MDGSDDMEQAHVTIKEAYVRHIADQLKTVIDQGFLIMDTKFNESKAQLTFVAVDAKPLERVGFRKLKLQHVLYYLYSPKTVDIEYRTS
jgi:hypothetical protein